MTLILSVEKFNRQLIYQYHVEKSSTSFGTRLQRGLPHKTTVSALRGRSHFFCRCCWWNPGPHEKSKATHDIFVSRVCFGRLFYIVVIEVTYGRLSILDLVQCVFLEGSLEVCLESYAGHVVFTWRCKQIAKLEPHKSHCLRYSEIELAGENPGNGVCVLKPQWQVGYVVAVSSYNEL